ncbi:hypothetical protein HYX17_04285 [Candidatus Woesearchaeota archaeon]|nr:hypothetical protein [Candidatus Woesearchaeota archaeon]
MNYSKYPLFFILIILNISIVLAGQIHDLDFSDKNIITATINERDVARFTLPYREYNIDKYNDNIIDYKLINKEHKVMIREISKNKDFARLTIFIQDAETPQYLNLGFKNIIKLDFDRDSLDDLIIRLNKINGNETTLTLESIQEDKKTGEVKLFGIAKEAKKENKLSNIVSFFRNLFSMNQTNQENKLIAGEEGKIEGSKPKIINLLAENWKITSIILVILLIIIWNRRYIKRKLRRLSF